MGCGRAVQKEEMSGCDRAVQKEEMSAVWLMRVDGVEICADRWRGRYVGVAGGQSAHFAAWLRRLAVILWQGTVWMSDNATHAYIQHIVQDLLSPNLGSGFMQQLEAQGWNVQHLCVSRTSSVEWRCCRRACVPSRAVLCGVRCAVEAEECYPISS